MATTLWHESATGPQGEFEVSTIQTDAGGAPVSTSFLLPFTTADYRDETPWPFETMVFRPGTCTGLFHEPHASKEDAKDRHAAIVSLCRNGLLPLGQGVRGNFGVPSLTAAEWNANQSAPKDSPQ